MEKSSKILDDHLVSKKIRKETFLRKIIRILFILCSTILILMCSFYFYFWNLTTQYLGWRPYPSVPDPKDLSTIPAIDGQIELKIRVIKLYEITDESFGFMMMIFFAMIPLLISFLFQIKREKNKLILVYGAIAMIMSSYLIFGGFLSWLLD